MKIIFKLLGNFSTTLGLIFKAPYWIKDWFSYDIFAWPEWLKITTIVCLSLLCILGIILSVKVSNNESQAETVPGHVVESTTAIAQGIVIGVVTATIIGAFALALLLKNNES
jgi:hypothetical protein